MSDYTELKRLAESATQGPWSYDGSYVCPARVEEGATYVETWRSVADCAQPENTKFIAAANPAAVLALIAENERLHESDQEATELCDTLSALLGEIAVAVRGPEEPKSRHGFHDLPSRVKTVVAERDQLRAEVAGLKTGYEAYERVNAELKAENEALRKELPGIRPFKPYQDSPVIGFTGCVICGVYTDHGGLPCPKTRATADAALGRGEQS